MIIDNQDQTNREKEFSLELINALQEINMKINPGD